MMMMMLETSSRRYHHRPTRTHTTGLQATPSPFFVRMDYHSPYACWHQATSSTLLPYRAIFCANLLLAACLGDCPSAYWKPLFLPFVVTSLSTAVGALYHKGMRRLPLLPTRCAMPSLMLLAEPNVGGSRPLWRLDEVRGDECTVMLTEVSWRRRQICAAHSLLPLRTSKWLPFKVLCVGVNMYSKPSHSNRSDHGFPLLTRALRPELEDGRIDWLSRPLPFFLVPNSCTGSTRQRCLWRNNVEFCT